MLALQKSFLKTDRKMQILAAALAALIWLAAGVVPAFAHSRVEAGPYVIILGWENEPVIVGERNALVIEVYEGDEPVTDLEGQIDLTVFYGGRSFIGQLAPTDKPGVYAAEIYPTLRGQYEVQLVGTIGTTSIDEILEPEEVLPANVLQFPESQPDPVALQDEITALQSELQTARMLAYGGLGAGILGIALGLAAFLRRQKS
jgi:hypothetical protein